MTKSEWQRAFRRKLEELREYEWSDGAWLVDGRKIEDSEGPLDAVARHMADVVIETEAARSGF